MLLYQPEQPLGQEVDTEDDFQSSSSLQRLTELMGLIYVSFVFFSVLSDTVLKAGLNWNKKYRRLLFRN